MFLKNRNIISKIKISKVTDYAALNILSSVLLFVTAVKGIIITFREPNKPGCLLGENSDHLNCLRRPLLFNFVIF